MGIQNGENGWLPTVQGRSGLSRDSLHPTSTSTESVSREEPSSVTRMTRNRVATFFGPTAADAAQGTTTHIQSTVEGPSGAMDSVTNNAGGPSKSQHPTIRFIPHVERNSARPSLQFTALSRTLTVPNSVVRVGRYSERDNSAADANVLPVGFKSKVVSRRHCEFWCTNGQWYVKDVKSSSGTFLNHVRLSPPGQESRPFPVNDGDVVQLGIDFKGGEELIFRCVKIRIECNRGWQKGLNVYNTNAHRKLLKSAGIKSKNRDSDATSVNSSECSICLNPVAPCQALFVAPCSHVWHYKCVKNLLHGPSYPNFLCPNCRFVADLEADVEPPEDLDEEIDLVDLAKGADESNADQQPTSSSEEEQTLQRPEQRNNTRQSPMASERSPSTSRSANATDEELAGLLSGTSLDPSSPTSSGALMSTDPLGGSTVTRPVTISQSQHQRNTSTGQLGPRSATPMSSTQYALAAGVVSDGPMTPRNDAGPFVLDGGAGTQRIDGIATRALEDESELTSTVANT